MTKERFADGLREALEEVRAWKRGEVALEARIVEPMPPERIRLIRKRVASSVKRFEERFRIPATTVTGWEQGRRSPDPAARVLLRAIARDPEGIERAAHEEVVAPVPRTTKRSGTVEEMAERTKRFKGGRPDLVGLPARAAAAAAKPKGPAHRAAGRGQRSAAKRRETTAR